MTLPFDGIDEISAYRNPDDSYQVNIEISTVDTDGNIKYSTLKIDHAKLDFSIIANIFENTTYDIHLRG